MKLRQLQLHSSAMGVLMMKKSILFLAVLALVGTAIPALGQAPMIDYVGYGWEDGGFPPSNPGDMMYYVAIGQSADAIFGVDLGTEELTVYIYDLVSTGDEILYGEAIDTNSAMAASLLLDHGFSIGRHHTCGDDLEDLTAVWSWLWSKPTR